MGSSAGRALAAVSFLALTPASAGAQETARPVEDRGILRLGSSEDAEIAGGEVHGYRIPAAAGDFVRLVVEQRGTNLKLALRAPGGQEPSDVDNNRDAFGQEYASMIAGTAGEVQLQVQAVNAKAPRSPYAVRLLEERPAEARERQLAAADAAFTQATLLRLKEAAASRREGIARYEEALGLYRAAGDRVREVETLNRISLMHIDLSEPEAALARLAEGLRVAALLDDPAWQGHLLNNSGLAHWIRADLRPALDFYERALAMRRAAGDRSGEVATLHNIGLVQRAMGDYAAAARSFASALPLRRAFGDRRGEANSLSALGQTQNMMGQTQQALDSIDRALGLWREVGERFGEALALGAKGDVYEAAGDFDRASEAFEQALAIDRALADARSTAAILHKRGDARRRHGDTVQARDDYVEALALRRTASDRRGQISTLASLARTRLTLGEVEAAERDLQEALALARETGDKAGEAEVLDGLGEARLQAGQPDRAAELFEQALSLRRAAGDRRGEAAARFALARAARARDRLDEARVHIAAALDLVESQRTAAASPELRAAFLASVQSYYAFEIDLLLALHEADPSRGWQVAALSSAERSRARGLLEVLVEGRVDLLEGLDAGLVARERDLRREINAGEFARVRLLGAERPDEARLAEVRAATDRLLTEYADLEGRIRSASPRAARLNEVRPPPVAEIQRELDPGSAILEYHLGEERSQLWVVDPERVRSFVLPPSAEIERLAERFHAALTARNRRPAGEAAEVRRARIAKADETAAEAAAALSRAVLAPALDALPARRIVLVPDGALRYVPFAALPARADRPDTPLIATHEVVTLPSASTLVALRRGRPSTAHAGGRLLVLADPVFAADDPRVRAPGRRADAAVAAPSADTDLTRAASDAGLTRFERLRFSRVEAAAISALTAAGQSVTALDFEASRSSLLARDLSPYRVLHLATHGLLDSRRPALSGLVLSLVDEEGRPQDGFLRLNDIFGLRLSADLVVMSACQTALGKDIRGEGVVGLSRGFLHAGAARVVASLWSVEDRATAELMTRFYRGFLREGRAPAAALQAAQASMARDPRFRAPYYWAAFMLEGEWR